MTTIPTIAQLYNGILADLEGQYNITIPLFGKNFLRAIASVQAAKLKLSYLFLAKVQKNIFIDTADPESIGGTLERFGRAKLGRNPFPAQAAQYEIRVTGTVGAIIGTVDAPATFKSNDDSLNPGILYVLDVPYTLVSTTDYITVRALTAGLDGQLNINDKLTATAPIALVDSLATVYSEVIEPLSAEDLEAYRAAGLNSYRLESQGGAPTDYRLWAQDAQGVAKVYPYAKSGYSNEINLFVEAVAADSDDGKGTPSQAILDAVEEVIEFNPDTTLDLLERGRRPLGVFEVHYLPVTVKEIDITITGFVGITAAIQALILDALTEAINDIRPFVAAADILSNKNDILDTNRIISIILNQQPGSVFAGITLEVDSVSVSTNTFINGDIPHLNSVTYV
jgi:hypothetical protein